jgi:hypothetical protein
MEGGKVKEEWQWRVGIMMMMLTLVGDWQKTLVFPLHYFGPILA